MITPSGRVSVGDSGNAVSDVGKSGTDVAFDVRTSGTDVVSDVETSGIDVASDVGTSGTDVSVISICEGDSVGLCD